MHSLILLSLLSSATSAQAQLAQPLADTQVEAIIRQFRQETGTPGVAAVVVQDGHTRLYGSGLSPQTPVAIASMSKSFTALVILQLAEQGRLQLDQSVQKVLPTFRTADPRSHVITVRQLLNQTSGLTDNGSGQALGSRRVTRQALLEDLHKAKLGAAPGTHFEYANVNYAVLALVAEQVTDEPFGTTLQKDVLQPLNMEAHVAENCAEQFPGQASGHTLLMRLALPTREPAGLCLGSGGMVLSAEALGRWLVEQFGPRPHLVTPEQLRLMHEPPRDGESTYGMGWYTIHQPELPTYLGHGGNLVTTASHMVYDPTTGTAIAVLLDSNGPAALLTLNLLRARHGLPVQRMRSPTFTLDLYLLALGTALTGWAGLTFHRRARWRQRVQGWPHWRRVATFTMLSLFPLLILLLPWLVFGASPTSWPVVWTLLPSTLVLWAAALGDVGILYWWKLCKSPR